MSVQQILTTFIGGFMFPFLVRMLWGEFEKEYGMLGGFLASVFIVGVMWLVNHGLDSPYIYQTGAFVDMGLAAFTGVWSATTVLGGKPSKSVQNIIAALLGGGIAGLILTCL